jgi:hypothetical protein
MEATAGCWWTDYFDVGPAAAPRKMHGDAQPTPAASFRLSSSAARRM